MAAGFMTHVTCRLTTKNRDQLLNPRSVIEYGLPLLFSAVSRQHRSRKCAVVSTFIPTRLYLGGLKSFSVESGNSN